MKQDILKKNKERERNKFNSIDLIKEPPKVVVVVFKE
jgi:hypothetical protein